MAQKVATYGPELMRMAEKSLLLQILDHLWKEHLLNLDHLRQGIHLRGYGQRDPLNEYKKEAFALFEAHAHQPAPDGDPGDHPSGDAHAAAAGGRGRGRGDRAAGGDRNRRRAPGRPAASGAAAAPGPGRERDGARRPQSSENWGKVGRNAPCPCGSGKKYKHCHGRLH